MNGVYNPPSGASSNLKYIGIKFGSAAPNYTVTATSNNTSYGTVSVSGNVITASPKAGYYAASYTVTSGTATVTQNGNTFTVNPSSNCTVRINFAAKTQYTVTLKANGSTYNTLSCYSGESVTLPSTATAVSGYSFAGWCANTVSETTSRPTILTGSYTPSGNVTLYAVYTRTEGGSGASGYQLVTSTPSNWAGNYVITNGNSTSMYVLKGVTPSSNGAQIEDANNATAYSNTGMSLSNNTLTNVSNAYVFTLAATGSYYTVKSTSTGAYMGTTSSSYLAGYTSYNSSYCRWTLSCSSGNVTAIGGTVDQENWECASSGIGAGVPLETGGRIVSSVSFAGLSIRSAVVHAEAGTLAGRGTPARAIGNSTGTDFDISKIYPLVHVKVKGEDGDPVAWNRMAWFCTKQSVDVSPCLGHLGCDDDLYRCRYCGSTEDMGIVFVDCRYNLESSRDFSIGLEPGSSLKITSDIYVPENKYFIGWNTSKDGSGVWYMPGDVIAPNASITLYAQWGDRVNAEYVESGVSQHVWAKPLTAGSVRWRFRRAPSARTRCPSSSPTMTTRT